MMDFGSGEPMPLDSLDIIAASQDLAIEDISRRMSNPKLMALRAQMPFIPIMPFPNESISLFLAAGVATDINLPSGTKMVMFSGNGEYFVSRKGNAVVPTAATPQATGSIMNPEFCFLYVEEINQMSAIAPYDMRLTVHCFVQI